MEEMMLWALGLDHVTHVNVAAANRYQGATKDSKPHWRITINRFIGAWNMIEGEGETLQEAQVDLMKKLQ